MYAIESDQDGLSGLPEAIRPLVKGQLDPENLKKAANQEIDNLPTEPVNKGDSWQRAQTANFGAGQVMTFQNKFTYEGTIEKNGKTLDKITHKTLSVDFALLGSVTPFQFMLGKLVGTVGVSLTIVSIYMLAGYLALRHAGYSDFFPAHLLPWFLLYQALAVLMYGSIFAAIGAAVTDAQEAQSSLMPVMIITMAPMFVFMNVLREPGSTMALAFSLFPPATPMLMILRQAVPPGIPIWQPLVGVALVLLTTTACVFAAGRIFRLGLLMQDKGADYRQMFRWVVSG